jgi:hypothetical protein
MQHDTEFSLRDKSSLKIVPCNITLYCFLVQAQEAQNIIHASLCYYRLVSQTRVKFLLFKPIILGIQEQLSIYL